MTYREFRKLRKHIYEYLNLFADSIQGYKKDIAFINTRRQVNNIFSILAMDAEAIFGMKLYCGRISVKFQGNYCDGDKNMRIRKNFKLKKRHNGYRLKIRYGAPEKEMHNFMLICFLLLQLSGYNDAEEKKIEITREKVCWMVLYYWTRIAERDYAEYLNQSFMEIVDKKKFEEITMLLGSALEDLPLCSIWGT